MYITTCPIKKAESPFPTSYLLTFGLHMNVMDLVTIEDAYRELEARLD